MGGERAAAHGGRGSACAPCLLLGLTMVLTQLRAVSCLETAPALLWMCRQRCSRQQRLKAAPHLVLMVLRIWYASGTHGAPHLVRI